MNYTTEIQVTWKQVNVDLVEIVQICLGVNTVHDCPRLCNNNCSGNELFQFEYVHRIYNLINLGIDYERFRLVYNRINHPDLKVI